MNAPQQVVSYDLLEAKLLRAIESNRQLAEELDDFWFNHFNVNVAKGADRLLTAAYERDTIRPHIWGKFRALLGATAHDPGEFNRISDYPVPNSGIGLGFPCI